MIDVEPVDPLGDAGDLLRYRLRNGLLVPIDPKKPFGPIGHSYLAVTCRVRGIDPGIWIDPYSYTTTGPKRTPAQTRFLIVCAIIGALWIAAAITYIVVSA